MTPASHFQARRYLMMTSRFRGILRQFRFSLRTLFILFAVVCAGIGFVAERYRRISRAVRRMEDAGARITYDYERGIGFLHGKYLDEALAKSRRKDWLRNIIYFPEQISIHSQLTESQLSEIMVNGATVAAIRDAVIFSDVTDAHAEQLSRYPRLQRVSIHSGKLTSRGAACLIQHPRLIRLDLGGCYNVTDSLVTALNGKPIPPTIGLRLDNTGISKAVAKQLDP